MKTLALIFGALSDPSRLRILNLLLASGNLCVCDIERTLKFTQTKVSRHMGHLRRAGLVTSRKSGRWVIYSLSRAGTAEKALVLAGLRTMLETSDAARADLASLSAGIRGGCCVGPLLRTANATQPQHRKDISCSNP